MPTVGVNPPKTPVTKGSSGIAAATMPNICKMPGPPAPFVPTPLPNIGTSDDSPQGYSTSVKIEGQPVAIQGASFNSKGDIASKGTGGGLVSNNTHGPTKFVAPGSMDVKIEGKNTQYLGDQMTNNNGPGGSPPNSATMTGVMQAPGMMLVIYGDDMPCGRCGKTHPVEAGKLINAEMAPLFEKLKQAYEDQKQKIIRLSLLVSEVPAKKAELARIKKKAGRVKGGGPKLTSVEETAYPELQSEVPVLEAELNALKDWFKGNALLRFDGKQTGTYSKGYMTGAVICECPASPKKLAASSGNATPGFKQAVESTGFTLANGTVTADPDSSGTWSCAAKQLIEKLKPHKPFQMVEKLFMPAVPGLKVQTSTQVPYKMLDLDGEWKPGPPDFSSGDTVPSCETCQANLPEMMCETKCG